MSGDGQIMLYALLTRQDTQFDLDLKDFAAFCLIHFQSAFKALLLICRAIKNLKGFESFTL